MRTATKKPVVSIPKVSAILKLETNPPTLNQRCPNCRDTVSTMAMDDGVDFIETPFTCYHCKQPLVIFEPAEKPRVEEKADGFMGTVDTAHPPIPGTGPQQWYEEKEKESRFNALTFGQPAAADDDKPKFPVLKSALLGALIAVVFMCSLIGGAYYFQIPPPGPKPAPAAVPTIAPAPRREPSRIAESAAVLNSKPAPSSGFLLKMNEDAWMLIAIDGKELLPGQVLNKGASIRGEFSDKVEVRCGKPGALSYFVNGHEVKPKNQAELTNKVEVVTLTPGMQ